ncbi:hypothetical protein [uncultured Clostridium sp.]|uniref:hypothetical protein n=1 Tax=uncultured Clostridium sp. TaxID=59620 RepID=UPI003216ACFA
MININKYYHYTQKHNIPDILRSKELKGIGVFACKTKEDIFKFINFYLNTGIIKLDETVLIEFETNIKFEESYDHDPKTFNNARAVVYWDGNVPLLEIRLLEIEYKKDDI